MGEIILGDNLDVLRTLPDGAFELIYIDPPFNTGREQSRTAHQGYARRRRRPHGFSGAALPDGGDGP